MNAEGKVYVTDVYNDLVQVFTADGQFLSKWGSEGTGNGQFIEPAEIVVEESGKFFYVTDKYRVQVFGKKSGA